MNQCTESKVEDLATSMIKRFIKPWKTLSFSQNDNKVVKEIDVLCNDQQVTPNDSILLVSPVYEGTTGTFRADTRTAISVPDLDVYHINYKPKSLMRAYHM